MSDPRDKYTDLGVDHSGMPLASTFPRPCAHRAMEYSDEFRGFEDRYKLAPGLSHALR